MEKSIIDMMIRIKNGYLARLSTVEMPYSNFSEAVLKKILDLKYIKSYSISEKKFKSLIIELLYEDGNPRMTDIKIFSTQGRRWYISHKNIKRVLGGFGNSVISTSKGIKTDIEAKAEKIGGELLFNIW